MSLIIDVAPPELDPDGAARLCLYLEKKFGSRLDAEQLARVRRFPLHGKSTEARLSRILARAAALRFLPEGAKIRGYRYEFSSPPAIFSLSFSHPPGRPVVALDAIARVAVDSERIDKNTLSGLASLMLRHSPKAAFAPASHIVRAWTIFESAVKLLGAASWETIARDVFRSELNELKWRGMTRVSGRELRWTSYEKNNYITTISTFSEQNEARPTLASLDWRELTPEF